MKTFSSILDFREFFHPSWFSLWFYFSSLFVTENKGNFEGDRCPLIPINLVVLLNFHILPVGRFTIPLVVFFNNLEPKIPNFRFGVGAQNPKNAKLLETCSNNTTLSKFGIFGSKLLVPPKNIVKIWDFLIRHCQPHSRRVGAVDRTP